MMLRFFILAWLWLLVSFAMMWWVQVSMDQMHRGAAETIGTAMRAGVGLVIDPQSGELVPASGVEEAARGAGPEDLARLEFDRRELMRRLRTLWISVTLVPLLIAGWYVSRLQSEIGRLRSAPPGAREGPAE